MNERERCDASVSPPHEMVTGKNASSVVPIPSADSVAIMISRKRCFDDSEGSDGDWKYLHALEVRKRHFWSPPAGRDVFTRLSQDVWWPGCVDLDTTPKKLSRPESCEFKQSATNLEQRSCNNWRCFASPQDFARNTLWTH